MSVHWVPSHTFPVDLFLWSVKMESYNCSNGSKLEKLRERKGIRMRVRSRRS